MRYFIFTLLFLAISPLLSQADAGPQAVSDEKPAMVKSIVLEGFKLEDKGQFVKLFKPYRNKFLTSFDISGLLEKIQAIYAEKGYQQLVTITWRLDRHRLIFTASMTS